MPHQGAVGLLTAATGSHLAEGVGHSASFGQVRRRRGKMNTDAPSRSGRAPRSTAVVAVISAEHHTQLAPLRCSLERDSTGGNGSARGRLNRTPPPAIGRPARRLRRLIALAIGAALLVPSLWLPYATFQRRTPAAPHARPRPSPDSSKRRLRCPGGRVEPDRDRCGCRARWLEDRTVTHACLSLGRPSRAIVVVRGRPRQQGDRDTEPGAVHDPS